MKPVLIQTLHRHLRKNKPKNLETVDISRTHTGSRDRAGFIVLLAIIFSIIVVAAVN